MSEPMSMSIVVASDLDDTTEAVMDAAVALARAFGGPLWLVHVAEPDPDFVGWKAGPPSVREQQSEQYRHEHRALQARAEALREAGVRATALLVQGATASAIVEEARKVKAGYIVMGSHGHGAAHDLLVGSVTRDVLKSAPCPVLVVPIRATNNPAS